MTRSYHLEETGRAKNLKWMESIEDWIGVPLFFGFLFLLAILVITAFFYLFRWMFQEFKKLKNEIWGYKCQFCQSKVESEAEQKNLRCWKCEQELANKDKNPIT